MEDLSKLMGSFGPWHLSICIITSFSWIPIAMHTMAIPFLALPMDFWCVFPNSFFNYTFNQTEEEGTQLDTCHSMRNGNKTALCEQWNYDTQYYHSIVSEWDLVCWREWLISFSQSVYMAGMMAGLLVLGHLADRMGRRPVLMGALFLTGVSGIGAAFSPSFTVFVAFRFLIAMGAATAVSVSFCLVTEVIGTNVRSTVCTVLGFNWTFGALILAGLAWLLRDWFYLQLAMSILCFPSVLACWFLPESPRWLLTHGYLERAEEVIHKAASLNGIAVRHIHDAIKKIKEVSDIEKQTMAKKMVNILDLVKTPAMRKRSLIMFGVWFVDSCVFYAIALGTTDLGGNPFVNFSAVAVVDFPAGVACIFILRHFGRRTPIMASLMTVALACLISAALPEDPNWIRILLAMLGKCGIYSAFLITYVWTAELFPTVIRSLGLSTSSMSARLGSITSPFLGHLGKLTHRSVPFVVCGSLPLVVGVTVLFLPECHHHMMDTIEEVEGHRNDIENSSYPPPVMKNEIEEVDPLTVQML